MGYVKPGIDISNVTLDKPLSGKAFTLDADYWDHIDGQIRIFEDLSSEHDYGWQPEDEAEIALAKYCGDPKNPRSSALGLELECPECNKQGFIYAGDYICVQCRYG